MHFKHTKPKTGYDRLLDRALALYGKYVETGGRERLDHRRAMLIITLVFENTSRHAAENR